MILIDQAKYLTIATIIFLIGIAGIFLNRKNLIIMLMSIELMLLGVNLNWIIFSVFLDDIMGQIMSLFILTVAAAESAIGLGILVVYYRVKQTIAVEYISLMKG
jgi:NADH-quinone oxidoreductase subunit K